MGKDYIEVANDFFGRRTVIDLVNEKGGIKAIICFISLAVQAASIDDGAYIRNEKGKQCKLEDLRIDELKALGNLEDTIEMLKRHGFLDEDKNGLRIGRAVLGRLIRL